jgi:hypothetical protein
MSTPATSRKKGCTPSVAAGAVAGRTLGRGVNLVVMAFSLSRGGGSYVGRGGGSAAAATCFQDPFPFPPSAFGSCKGGFPALLLG